MTDTTKRDGEITADICGQVATIYRWNVTPEGEGLVLEQADEGDWVELETGIRFETIDEAKAAYTGP